MRLPLEVPGVLVEPQQDGLGHVLGLGPVPQGVAGHTEYGVAVGPGPGFKSLVGHGKPPFRVLKALSHGIPHSGGKYLT